MINTGTATPRLDLLGPILQEGIAEEAYVAHRILPSLIVQKRTGAIPSFLFSDAQALSIKHAPKTGFAQIQSKLGQNTYSCTEAGVEEPLSVEDYEILGKDYAYEIITRKLVHIVLRARDYALSQAIFSAGGETTFATNLVTASLPWDNAGGTPVEDVLQAKRNIALQTGLPGNAMVMGYDAYINLCKSAQIRTLVRNVMGYSGAHTQDAVASEIPTSVLAMTFGLDEIIVAPGVVDANKEGAATKSLGFIWPADYALVFRKSKNAGDVREAALGRTFVYDLATEFNELTYMNATDTLRALMIEMYPDPKVNADFLRAREYIDMQILLPTAGSLIKSLAT
jgi:hypothetical protein